MQIKTAKAAVLAESRKPLIVDQIELPDALGVGHVLVKVLYTTICGAQINEIEAAKGPDKFLPHLLGHEASASVIDIGPGVTTVKPGDTVVLHWRPSLGIQGQPPGLRVRATHRERIVVAHRVPQARLRRVSITCATVKARTMTASTSDKAAP